jgi:hypothetical protein
MRAYQITKGRCNAGLKDLDTKNGDSPDELRSYDKINSLNITKWHPL